MLLIDETIQKYGVPPSSLSKGSSKKVCVICDYCGCRVDKVWKARIIQNQEVDKDACKACKFKKRESVSLSKFGVKNASQRLDVAEKLSDIDWPQHKEKIIEMLSSGWSIANIASKLNLPRTSISRRMKAWRVKSNSSLQSKKEKTCIEKYGDNYTDNQAKKREQTNFKKYGVTNPFQSEEVKTKIRKKHIKTYGVDHPMKSIDVANRSRDNSLKTKISKGLVITHESKTMPEIAVELGWSVSRFHVLVKQHGLETAMQMTKKISSLEQTFQLWLTENNISHSSHFKVLNDNKYYVADFKIGNLLIELDGLYWHSDAVVKDKFYHQKKRLSYIDNGFTPLFFRENEILNKFHIVKSIILNKLKKSRVIYGRKCEVRQPSKKEGGDFLQQNHLMGARGGTHFGLYHEDKLVCVLCMRKIKDNNYELSRFATALGVSIIGGFSKLISAASKHLSPDSITTFIDLRYGQGTYLSDLGFKHMGTHLSFNWTNGADILHRMNFPGSSGYDSGFYKIWDCGQAKHIKTYS